MMELDQVSRLALDAQALDPNGPALAPPPGEIPNFENPPNDTKKAYVALTLCLLITAIAISVRIHFKATTTKRPSFEDRKQHVP